MPAAASPLSISTFSCCCCGAAADISDAEAQARQPAQCAARFLLKPSAPLRGSRPIVELRPPQHIGQQRRRARGQHWHDVAPTHDSRGAPRRSQRACPDQLLQSFSPSERKKLRCFFLGPPGAPFFSFFSPRISHTTMWYNIISEQGFFYKLVLFTGVCDGADSFCSVFAITQDCVLVPRFYITVEEVDRGIV